MRKVMALGDGGQVHGEDAGGAGGVQRHRDAGVDHGDGGRAARHGHLVLRAGVQELPLDVLVRRAVQRAGRIHQLLRWGPAGSTPPFESVLLGFIIITALADTTR